MPKKVGTENWRKKRKQEHSGQTPTAIAPGTKVYELVEELAKYLPEDKQSKFL